MKTAIADLSDLLRRMSPVHNPGVFVFATLPAGSPIEMQAVVACVRESEGTSVVLAEADAIRLGLPVLFRSAWLTLTVHSDLNAIGLTAAVSIALAQAGISCNVVAGAHHDHIFVPHDQADAAMAALIQLQQTADQ
ncbi:MAG TPA: ACT domain-containing protein [Gemmatimonadaceae bacterium]|nr:ACT domain-containing protein [Gemmatimonadaceae bacterium]